jgi:hypothetical protein
MVMTFSRGRGRFQSGCATCRAHVVDDPLLRSSHAIGYRHDMSRKDKQISATVEMKVDEEDLMDVEIARDHVPFNPRVPKWYCFK